MFPSAVYLRNLRIFLLTLRNLRSIIKTTERTVPMKQRDLVRKLTNAGFKQVRKGDHKIFEKPGHRSVQVPDHREINENTARAILKDAGLK